MIMPATSSKPAESPLSRRKNLLLIALILASGILWLATLSLLIVIAYRSWGLIFHPETTSLQVFFELQESLPLLLLVLSITIFLSGLFAIIYFVMAGSPLGIFGLRPKPEEEEATGDGKSPLVSYDGHEPASREKNKKARRGMGIDRQLKQFSKRLEPLDLDESMPEKALKQFCHQLEASLGMIFTRADEHTYVLKGTFATDIEAHTPLRINKGEGLNGEVARTGKAHHLKDIPEGYMPIRSGLGKGCPRYLSILPVKDENDTVVAVLELASFSRLQPREGALLQKMCKLLARHIVRLPREVLATPKKMDQETPSS